MPTRKQRRRREKEFRHEYETVVLDEEGNEVELDPEERRKQREERERQRAEAKPAKGKAQEKKPARAMKEPPVPSWRRAARRGGLMGAVIFIAFVFILRGGSQTSRAAIAIVYAVAFIPLTYFVDRFAYRSYQKRLARQNEKKKA